MASDRKSILAQRRRGMLLRATLAQNVGTGCAFGALATSVMALQDKFQASLGIASMGISLTLFSMTAIGPWIGGLIGRFGLRPVMVTGVVLSLFGYLALAFAPTMSLTLVACALLVGPGAALFAALPPAVLAAGWYPDDQGKVMGITYLPLLITFLPVLAVKIIENYGLTALFLVIAAIHALLLPLMFGVAAAPLPDEDVAESIPGPAITPTRIILGSALFWLIMMGDGILNGTAITGSAIMLPIFSEYGYSMDGGAMLLLVGGLSSMVGSLLSGFVCDRIGSAKTLALAGSGFATAWFILSVTSYLPALVLASALIGLCGASVFPPISTLVVQIFGFRAMSKALGLLGLLTLPFTLLMPPVAGWLRDASGNYELAYAGIISVCILAAATFFGMSRYLAGKGSTSSPITAG